MPPSEDEISLGDNEFGVPKDPVEQDRFKRRLMATARSLKKKQQQLQADQDLLTDRWTEVLAAEEYGLERQTADRPPRGRDKTGYQPEYQPAPHADTLRPRATGKTCKIFWKTKQDSQDRSTDRGGAPQHATMIVAPDTSSTNPAGPNTATQTNSSCVAT